MKRNLLLTIIILLGCLPYSKGSDVWPEKYVRSTNNQVWNLIGKRCKTDRCLDHLKKLKEEKQQSVRSNGCENIYPQPRTVDERIAKCGTADSKSVSGGSKTSPVDRIWSLPSPKRSEKVTGNYRNNFRLREFGQKY